MIVRVLPLVLLAFAACSEGEKKPNILLVTLDTVRADHVGCYGRKPGLTPAIDGLASRGVRFARCVAPSPITLPSHATMLTGQYPIRHGARDNSVYFLSDDAVTLAEELSAGGYRTGAAVSSIALSSRFGLQQGFEVFEEGKLVVEDGQQYKGGTIERDGSEVTYEAVRFMDAREEEGRPFFFWAHYYDPHEPYVWREHIDPGPAATPYESEVRYVDHQVGRLLDHLKKRGLAENTLIVLTADHGEGLGEHHERTHLVLTYETTLSVPLIFAGPDVAQGRVVEDRLGRLVDIMPTVLELARVEQSLPSEMDGTSLAPLLDYGDPPPGSGPRIAYFETMGPLSFDWSYLDGVATMEWKLIRGPEDELYHLPSDPIELNDVLEKNPEIAAKLSKAADEFAAIAPRTGGLVEMAGRQSDLFGALGYLSLDARSRRPSRNAPHPRDMVSVLDILQQAQAFYGVHQYDKALPYFEECARLSPGTALFHDFVGKCKLKLSDSSGAEEAYRRALSIHPEMIDTRLALGIALVNQKDFEGGEQAFREVIQRSPASHKGYGYLANLMRITNRPEEELKVLEELFERAEIPAEQEPALRAEMEKLRADKNGSR